MSELFNIKKGDIISITGAGGKTSLMFYLANKLKEKGSVLVATTTKIFKPETIENNSFIFIYPEEIESLSPQDNFIHVFCPKIENNKICSADFSDLNRLKAFFDFILIEADGSANKPLKGWKDNEPNIYPKTTKTIAVVDITALNKEKNPNTIHRFDLFQKQYPNLNKTIEKNDYIGYINSNTFFKGSFQEKILFFNKIESLDSFENFFNIVNNIDFNSKIYFGSILEKEIFLFKNITPIILAAGFSKRFLGNKLEFKLKNNKSILEKTLSNISKLNFKEKILIGKNTSQKELSKKYNFIYVNNIAPELGQSHSVILGAQKATLNGFLFIPGDMPFLTKKTIITLVYKFQSHNQIIVPFVNNEKKAPVLFPYYYLKDLINLKGDNGGRKILKKEKFIKCNFENSLEFFDIDTQEDLKKIELLED
ncbi:MULTISPECIES: selenium cofactor biosynthesis protein YqeC [Cetobacterium]|jgi:probable selenium-dependent hydroxylase accessory protein YqeC|uniref:Selenium cofactor biosynthesis protein YqeC n=1 Tax=Candidatus Cetobacterium colombiensis TaxID=3073100 RepID=A0ABU4W7N9_9FUSO|nr:selenium cofactor biosynthesis protein YqeC [Candidatus Cetobacterium colombiensis]MDX8335536.1 selenium cofactor biosynthesis protein YqeC [Candidatus Cetobacterium colombiensis]